MLRTKSLSKDRMVRKQVLLTKELNAGLNAAAVETSRPEGELVREALDEWLSKRKGGTDDWKKHMEAARGIWRNSGPSDEELAENRRRRGQRRDAMNARMHGED